MNADPMLHNYSLLDTYITKMLTVNVIDFFYQKTLNHNAH